MDYTGLPAADLNPGKLLRAEHEEVLIAFTQYLDKVTSVAAVTYRCYWLDLNFLMALAKRFTRQ